MADIFHPAVYNLDSRFLPNLGGDGSNMLSRAIYEVIPYVSDSKPTLTLELYTKFNAKIADQREIHGNLIMHGKVNDGDSVLMGFLFSPEPIHGKFDGFQASTTVDNRANAPEASNAFIAADMWTTARPFTTESFDAADLTNDDANDWNITAEKSLVDCYNGDCVLKAHFNRPFANEDA